MPSGKTMRKTAMRSAMLERWHQSPVLWLGAGLFAASLLGCILTIILAVRHADPALEVRGEQLLDVPAMHTARDP